MNRMFTGAVTLAGSLALAGGAIVATAMPAAASPHGPDNLAYATYAPTGTINTGGPNGLAEAPPAATTVDPNDSIAGVVRTGTTTDTAGTDTAFSKVTNPSTNTFTWFSGPFTYTLRLSASQVSTSCNSNTFGSTANVIGGRLTETSQFLSLPVTTTVFNLPQHPFFDKTYTFHGATVVLNDDDTSSLNTLEIQGVNLTVPTGPPAQTLTIATTACTATGLDSIVNGGFETGTFFGWTTSGAATSVSALEANTGAFSALAGVAGAATTGNSNITQTFAADGTTLSFWYDVHCNDVVAFDWATATLVDNTTGVTTTVLPHTCVSPSSGWTQVTASLTPGDSYTLTLTNHDDGLVIDPTWTFFDDVTVF